MTVKITVNGTEHEVEGGGWLIDTLNELGCDIPHFCYHPGLGPDGNCRMCQVEFVTDRGARAAISCNAQVSDGLNIVTNSDTVKRARAAVEEFLLLNHPLDCPICDKAGECTLQNYYMAHDMKDSRQDFVRFTKTKAVDIGPTMVLDQERCVLCDRCVRFLRDWAGEEQLYIAGRGHSAFLTPFPGKDVDSAYSLNTVDLCPVGALTSKDFRFAIPTWFLKRTPSTCTSCSRGCAIEVDTNDSTVHRLRPRHNPHVNGYWMCDEGRLNYRFVNTERVKEAAVDRSGEKFDASLENAMNEVSAMLGIRGEGTTDSVVILVSATCTLEEMYLLKRLAAARADTKVFVALHVPDGVEDDKLRRADRHSNVKGAELLGIDVLDLRSDASAVPAGTVLLAVGFDYEVGEPLSGLRERFDKMTVMTSRASGLTAAADVVLPGLTFAEKEGLIVSFEGHIQQLNPAFDNLWDRTPPWELIAEWVALASGEDRIDSVAGLRKALNDGESAFSAVNLNSVGATGVRLTPQSA